MSHGDRFPSIPSPPLPPLPLPTLPLPPSVQEKEKEGRGRQGGGTGCFGFLSQTAEKGCRQSCFLRAHTCPYKKDHGNNNHPPKWKLQDQALLWGGGFGGGLSPPSTSQMDWNWAFGRHTCLTLPACGKQQKSGAQGILSPHSKRKENPFPWPLPLHVFVPLPLCTHEKDWTSLSLHTHGTCLGLTAMAGGDDQTRRVRAHRNSLKGSQGSASGRKGQHPDFGPGGKEGRTQELCNFAAFLGRLAGRLPYSLPTLKSPSTIFHHLI